MLLFLACYPTFGRKWRGARAYLPMKTSRKSTLWFYNTRLGACYFGSITRYEVIHGLLAVRRVIGGSTPKASQVKKKMFCGTLPIELSIILSIKWIG